MFLPLHVPDIDLYPNLCHIFRLHEEVLAQRALDRRLTEELMRFKYTIVSLTEELKDVKEHDTVVTAQATTVQREVRGRREWKGRVEEGGG